MCAGTYPGRPQPAGGDQRTTCKFCPFPVGSGDGTGVVRLNNRFHRYLNHLMGPTVFFTALALSFGRATSKQTFPEAVVSPGTVHKLRTVNSESP